MTLAKKIPNHPTTCNGVRSPIYDDTQCRLCWLATYDRGYARLWGIPRVKAPYLPLVDRYPCLHRGTDQVPLPGCSTCGGAPLAYSCGNERTGATRCLVSGSERQENLARSQGFLICKDCGWREPDQELEMPLSQFRLRLEEPSSSLPAGWWDWKVARIGMRDAIRDLAALDPPPASFLQKKYAGRGIVTCAGGPKYFRCAFAMVHVLRYVGCRLPIQFWYLPGEMDEFMLDVCKEYDIETVDASSLGIKTRILSGWELKPFSVQHSRFAEIPFLDADCLPLRDPTFLFETQEYCEDGAIFWPDLERAGSCLGHVRTEVWDRVGLPVNSEPDFESGQYLVNKMRCYRSLNLTTWMNQRSDYWYKFIYGDKDTFHLAWRACEQDYFMPPACSYVFPCVVQRDAQGEPLFHHACQGKSRLCLGEPWSEFPHPEPIIQARKSLQERIKALTRYGSARTILQTEPYQQACRF